MEVIELFNKFNENLGSYIFSRWIGRFIEEYQTSRTIFIIATVLLLIFLIASIFVVRKWKNKEFLPEVKEFVGVGTGKPRFRKRDKVLFYGRKMLRKVKSIGGQVHATGQGKKRRAVMRFARRLLQLKKDTAPQQLKVLEPPAEYLEEDLGPGERVPPDALYMLQSIRVFGHFEKPVFLKLCKYTEIMNLPAGSTLFKIGDPDENLFIVQQGLVNVYITGPDGSQISLKVVKTGESVTSLLSFTDVLTGHTSTYKTVSARAVEDSIVVKLPMSAFQEVFQDYPDAFVRVIQVIMVRLQRVTFTALHQYLGLSAELVNQGSHKKKQSPFSGSPVRSRTRENFASQNVESVPGIFPTGTSEMHDTSDIPQCDAPNSSTSQPVPIVNQRARGNADWKTLSWRSSNLQAGNQSSAEMVPECDSHWATPPLATMPQSAHGSHPESTHSGSTYSSKKRQVNETAQQQQQQLDEAQLIQIATDAFVHELGIEDETVLKDKVQIREVPAGTYLMKEESHKDVALVYVLSGSLIVSQRVSEGRDAGQEVHMFSAHQGEIVGGLAVLTGEPSFYTIRAKHSSRIALLSKLTFFAIMREQPTVVLHVAHTVVRRLSPFVRQVDFALDWLFLESGRAVYRQGDESDSTFIVLSGRLRSVITYKNGKKEPVAEYGKGDLVGIVEMVTQTPRSTTVMAIRDSELAKLPEGLFNVIKLRYPIVVTRLINLLGHRILGTWQQAHTKNGSNDTQRAAATVDARPAQVNFSTVAIVPVSDDVPLTSFTYELYHSLCAIGPCLRLTSDVVRKTLGTTIMEPANEYRLTSWLAQQEDQHRISLYQCDSSYTLWTQRCARQADCILIVGLGDRPPSIGRTEREIERLVMRTQKELVLLHKEQNGQRPTNTVQWLNMRTWVSSHHHIQCPKRMFARRSLYRIGFLLTLEESGAIYDYSCLKTYKWDIILEKQINKKTLLLLRKIQNIARNPRFVRVNNYEFTWVDELKSIMSTQNETSIDTRIILVAEGDSECGLLGLINCLRKESGGEMIRGVFIQDDKAPAFSLQEPMYIKQLQLDLPINVIRSGNVWGSYRHFPIPSLESKLVQSAYVTQMVQGDLSTLCWAQSRMSRINHEDFVDVTYTSVNFRDIMVATGRLNAETIAPFERGNDCFIGLEFVGFNTHGQRIMGLCSHGGMTNILVADKYLSWIIPEKWTMEDAATVPCVYSTCYYALYIKGKMKKGNKVLIHSGTGGIGQAAIHLALHEGCEVFTTVGTVEKRQFIREMFPSISEDRIGNSRDTSFEQMIMQRTGSRGVDIVLNSLAKEKLQASVRCLANNGRFLEIGKFDMVSNNLLDLFVFSKGISFYGILLDKLFYSNTEKKSKLWKIIAEGLENGAVKPLCRKVFGRNEMETAFRYMAAGKHIGKIIIKVREENEPLDAPLLAHPQYYCLEHKCYVILGGLGGFGLELADWLTLRGAKNLVLTSRTGIRTGYQQSKVKLWRSYGVDVQIVTVDDNLKHEDCESILKFAEERAPVDAIFNLAVVLKDCIFQNQSPQTFEDSFKSKAWMTKKMDQLSRKICPQLRHFVVFSSVSCGRGNAGQTNY